MAHRTPSELLNVSRERPPLLQQTWTMSAIFLNILSIGILQQTLGELHSDRVLPPFLASFNSVATVIGYITSSILMDLLGRKWTFILGMIPGILACVIAIFPDSTWAQTSSMTLNDLSAGFTVILGIVVIGEHKSPKYRGVYLNLVPTSLNIGCTIGLLLRSNYNLELIWTALVLQLVSFGIAVMWPEIPCRRASIEYKTSEASYLRISDNTCEKDPEGMIALRQKTNKVTVVEMSVNMLKKYSSGAFLRPLTVIIFGVILMVTSGRHILTASSLETSLSIGVDYHTYEMVILSCGSIITLVLVLMWRYRTLLLVSGSFAASVMIITSIYVFLVGNNCTCDNISWLVSLLFVLQLVLSNLGSATIPIALIGEVFPMGYKAVGSSVSGIVLSVTAFSVDRSTPYLLNVLHLQGLLVIFAALTTISVLVLFVILPETKNKTLLEIEKYFKECSKDKIGESQLIEYYAKVGTIPIL